MQDETMRGAEVRPRVDADGGGNAHSPRTALLRLSSADESPLFRVVVVDGEALMGAVRDAFDAKRNGDDDARVAMAAAARLAVDQLLAPPLRGVRVVLVEGFRLAVTRARQRHGGRAPLAEGLLQRLLDLAERTFCALLADRAPCGERRFVLETKTANDTCAFVAALARRALEAGLRDGSGAGAEEGEEGPGRLDDGATAAVGSPRGEAPSSSRKRTRAAAAGSDDTEGDRTEGDRGKRARQQQLPQEVVHAADSEDDDDLLHGEFPLAARSSAGGGAATSPACVPRAPEEGGIIDLT